MQSSSFPVHHQRCVGAYLWVLYVVQGPSLPDTDVDHCSVGVVGSGRAVPTEKATSLVQISETRPPSSGWVQDPDQKWFGIPSSVASGPGTKEDTLYPSKQPGCRGFYGFYEKYDTCT